MAIIILPPEKYIELTAALAKDILQATYLDVILIEHENGDIRYTEEAQDCFHEHLEMVEDNLSAHGIYKEGDQPNPDDDGQPDEAQEWHDFDPDC